MASSNALKSIIYENENHHPKLKVLDQLLIPESKVYIPIEDVEAAWTVIRTMQIRGAPLIAIVATLGLVVDITSEKTSEELSSCCSSANGEEEMFLIIRKKVDYLRTSRPTAVNLFNAMDELTLTCKEAIEKFKNKDGEYSNMSLKDVLVETIVSYGENMLRLDILTNRAIGAHGAEAIWKNSNTESRDGVSVVTICNTGSLATAGYGTALGVVRSLIERNQLESVTALETRPYNQGSRLTAFEMVEENMPKATLITDSMVAAYMNKKKIDAVVVGADRICANGDTANKIGTLQLAILAKYHNVPFYVAAPFTTLDVSLKSGSSIEIEERPPSEFIETSRAPASVTVWNPSFDVTPASLITGGIITEHGVITKLSDEEEFNVIKFVHDHEQKGVNVDDESNSTPTKRGRFD